jgi:hypothetical protein
VQVWVGCEADAVQRLTDLVEDIDNMDSWVDVGLLRAQSRS